MLTDGSTLTRFLIEERRRHPGASAELNSLILDVALAMRRPAGCSRNTSPAVWSGRTSPTPAACGTRSSAADCVRPAGWWG